MSFFSYFLNETMLFGVAAAGVPWLIHMFNRARYDIQPWGAMIFLQSSVNARARSIKLRQWILLILRSVFFLFLALAMARPILNPAILNVSTKDTATTHVLIIDSSGSTQYGNAENQVFDLIRNSALTITGAMKPDDTMLILQTGRKSMPLFRNPVSDPEFLNRKINSLRAGYGKARIIDATIQAMHLLSDSKTSRHAIHILTDSQSVNWPANESVKWEEFQRVYDLQKIKPQIDCIQHTLNLDIPNIQVVQIKQDFPIVDIYRRNRFTVEIRNDGPPKRTHIDFFSGTQLESERDVDLSTGSNSISFDATFNTPGPHYVRARIPGDCLLADNTVTLALNVVNQLPVLLVEGQSASDPLESDGGCLVRALNPSGQNSDDSLIAVTSRNQTVLDDVDAAFLSNFKSIILVNVSSLSTRFRSRLSHFVRLGGGVFICLGPDVNVDNYNILFKDDGGLLPCFLENQTPFQRSPAVPFVHASAGASVFTSLQTGNDSIFDNLRINQFHIGTAAKDAQVLASCKGSPLLLTKGYGKGQVVLWTSTVNGDWNNFPFTENFLPVIQNIVVYLSSNIRPPTNLNLGETLLFSTPVERNDVQGYSQPETILLTKPNSEKVQLPIVFDDGRWLARYENTQYPGLYTITFNEQDPRYYAVNIGKNEGHLDPLGKQRVADVETKLHAIFIKNTDKLAALNRRASGPTEIWHIFIILALLVLGVEQILGYTFK